MEMIVLFLPYAMCVRFLLSAFPSFQGEKFLFQAGETMQIHELPEGTRVIYPGVRSDGVNNPDKASDTYYNTHVIVGDACGCMHACIHACG